MFDIGWTELVLIGVVGLIVIGPKDLPDMFRTFGRFTAKARSMARDFQRAMDAAADEAGVKDVAKDLKKMTSPQALGLDAVKQAATKFEKWDPLKPAPKPVLANPADPETADVKAAAPLGPATQALADAQAAKRGAQANPVATLQADPDAPPPKPKVVAKAAPAKSKGPMTPLASAAAASKPKAAAKIKAPQPDIATAAPAVKSKAAKSKAPAEVMTAAAKPARKPRKSPDAGKTDA